MGTEAVLDCVATHLIDGKGKIDQEGLEKFSKLTHLSKAGLNYTTVAIMGPQSSGKSTLLNHLFKSKFKMMNAEEGRTQTTLGIWLAKSPIIDRCTLIMDLEGNDGRERGDDNNFESKIALFSLVLSDTLLINMWYQDVGREKAANKPLIRIIFQAMLRLFAPRKTTLLFVIRDMGKTSLEKISGILLRDTLEIWDSIPKPKENKDATFHDYFLLDVVGLSHYEFAHEKFMEDVAELRKRFSSPSGTSLKAKPLVPGIDFVRSTSEIWDRVITDKALDIPSHKTMIAKVRCEQIDNDKFNGFLANQEWTRLKRAVNTPPVPGFGQKVTSMVDKCLAEYDEEAEFYEEVVKVDHREKLKQRLLQEIKPTLKSLMDNVSSQILNDFKSNLDKDLNGGKKFREAADWSQMLLKFDNTYEDSRIQQATGWTSVKARDELVSQISNHLNSMRSMKQNEVTNLYKSKLKSGLTESMRAILTKPGSDTWVNLRDLFKRETESSCSEFRVALEDLGISDTTKKEALETLMTYGRDIVEKGVRKESDKILQFMQDKFRDILLNEHDTNIPRSWKGDENVQDIVKTARTECVKIISAMAILRSLENKESDNIEDILSNAFLGEAGVSNLTSNQWDGVEASKTLMSPVTCGVVWDQFLKNSGMLVNSVNQILQARKDAEKAVAGNNQPQQQVDVMNSILRTLFPVPALLTDLILGKL